MKLVTQNTLIASGASQSSVPIDLEEHELIGILLPAAWTAASLSFQGSTDGVTFVALKKSDNTELTFTVAADGLIGLTIDEWKRISAAPFLLIISGTTAARVNQGADRTLKVVLQKRGN